MPLNAKQKLFVQHYIVDRNATKAYKAAGYSPIGAGNSAFKLLKNPHVAKAVEKELGKLNQQVELSAQMVLDEIKKLAFVDLTKAFKPDGTLLELSEMPEDVRKALVGLETDEIFIGRGTARHKIGATRKIKIADKVRSLEMLAKHFKLLTDVTELTGKDGGPVVVLTMPSNGSEKEED